MNGRSRSIAAGGEGAGNGHFVIGAAGRIVEWDDGAACLTGVPARAALGRACDEVIRGQSAAGAAVCGRGCAASRALAAGSIAGASRIVVRAAGGARIRLCCELVALPGGGALGRLRRAADATPDLEHELAGIAALAGRAAGEPLQQGLRDLLDFLLHSAGADAAEAFLALPHQGGVVCSCRRGRHGPALRELQRFDPGEGFPGLVLAHGEAVYSDHLCDDPRFLRARVKREGIGSYVCSPLASQRDTLGCVALAFRRRDVDLSRVLELLRWVSLPMGPVVEAALARQRDAVRAPLLQLRDDALPRLPQALGAVLEQLLRVGRADGAEAWLRSPQLALSAQLPDAAAVPPCPVLQARSLRQCPAFAAGATSLLHGRRETWPLPCRRTPHPGGAWCCLPLASEGEVLGLVRLRYRHLRPLPPQESIALLEGLAAHVAEHLAGLRARSASDPRTDAALRAWLQREAPALPEPAAQRLPAAARGPGEQVRLEIRCLGRLDLTVDGVPVPPQAIRRRRVPTLLGVLLTHHGRPQRTDALVETLWPGADPAVRVRQLHVLVHELRRLLEPRTRAGEWRYVCSQGDGYVFRVQPSCWIDTHAFGAMLDLGRRAEAAREPRAAIGAYEAAAELYRGEYLQEAAAAEWCAAVREQLREACLAALGRLAALWGTLGRWDKSMAWARRALLLDPLREEMHRALMYALWASGRRAQAVRQYEACVQLLREGLDLAPLPETERLYARIRAAARPYAAA